MTKTQQLINGILASGYKEVDCKSGKYRQFEAKDTVGNAWLFVGKAGALRYGRTASTSRSATDGKIYNQFLEKGKAEGK